MELASEKPAGERLRRASRVQAVSRKSLQYRFDNDSGVRTLVDLQRNEVRDVERVDGSTVPLTRADLDEAVKLALDASEVRELLGRGELSPVCSASTASATKNPPYAIRALLLHSFADNDPCHVSLRALILSTQQRLFPTDSAIVDLTERRVRIEGNAMKHDSNKNSDAVVRALKHGIAAFAPWATAASAIAQCSGVNLVEQRASR